MQKNRKKRSMVVDWIAKDYRVIRVHQRLASEELHGATATPKNHTVSVNHRDSGG